jgi:hypothetical protein
MPQLHVKQITYLGESRPDRRKLRLRLSNGTEISAVALYESWQQWGGTHDELCVTQPVVERHNDWLHGGERP